MAVRELDSLPGLRALYPRAVLGGGRAALGKLPGLGGGERELPDTELVLPDAEIDRDNLTAYDRVCGFRLSDRLPPTYPHLLAFPLSMQLMTDSAFPFPVIGLVHIENRIEHARPLDADRRLTVRVRAANLRPHDKGTQFEILAEAESDGATAWRSTSTYLHRDGSGSSGKRERDEPPEPPAPNAVWTVPEDIGRRYAAVSGDRNPIHLRALTARLFGMKRHIAHGMWLKARCLAALEGTLPEAFAVEVRFKLPVLLPSKVAFSTAAHGDERELSLHDARSGKPHLAGKAH